MPEIEEVLDDHDHVKRVDHLHSDEVDDFEGDDDQRNAHDSNDARKQDFPDGSNNAKDEHAPPHISEEDIDEATILEEERVGVRAQPTGNFYEHEDRHGKMQMYEDISGDGGVLKRVLKPGDATVGMAPLGQVVKIHYDGWFIGGRPCLCLPAAASTSRLLNAHMPPAEPPSLMPSVARFGMR